MGLWYVHGFSPRKFYRWHQLSLYIMLQLKRWPFQYWRFAYNRIIDMFPMLTFCTEIRCLMQLCESARTHRNTITMPIRSSQNGIGFDASKHILPVPMAIARIRIDRYFLSLSLSQLKWITHFSTSQRSIRNHYLLTTGGWSVWVCVYTNVGITLKHLNSWKCLNFHKTLSNIIATRVLQHHIKSIHQNPIIHRYPWLSFWLLLTSKWFTAIDNREATKFYDHLWWFVRLVCCWHFHIYLGHA